MLDPRLVKQRALNKAIRTVLADKRYTSDQNKAIQRFWQYVDAIPDLRLGSKKNYMQNARRILLYFKTCPDEWNANTMIKIVNNWRRKPDGSEYHPQYRNTIRIAEQ